MKNDLKKGFLLIRYGLNVPGNLGMAIFFFVLGLVLVVLYVRSSLPLPALSVDVGTMQSSQGIDLGALFLFCAVMFLPQLVISVDVATMAQSSPYKKRLQTVIPSLLMGLGALITLTIVAAAHLAGFLMGGDVRLVQEILYDGLLECVLLIYFGFIYKFFVVSIVVLYVGLMGFEFGRGLLSELGIHVDGWLSALPPAACIALAYLLVLAGCAAEYLISCAFYKRAFSKRAFGACRKGGQLC